MAKLSLILECVNVRTREHLGNSVLTGMKGDNNFAIKEHHLFCNHSSGFDDFSIPVSNNNDFKFTLMECLLINRGHPLLKKKQTFATFGTF